MTESILTSVKKMLGIDEAYEHFDPDIIMHINSVLAILIQMGVGPSEGFSITGKDSTWSDFLGEDAANLDGVKTYVYMKVRLIFDPPTSSAAIESMTRLASEFEWRLNVTADVQKKDETSDDTLT